MRQSTEIRKEQIKEAVLFIVYNEGIKKFTTKRLAGVIGISEAAIFRHYASKKDIFLDILADVETQLIDSLNEILDQPLAAKEHLRRVICQTINFMVQNKGINVLMLSEVAVNNDPDLKSKLAIIFNSQREIVERIVKRGIELGEFPKETDYKTFSLLYMGVPVAINVELLLNPTCFNVNNFCENMQHMFLQKCM